MLFGWTDNFIFGSKMKNKLISGLSSNFLFCILCNNEMSFICVLFEDELTLVTMNLLQAVIWFNIDSIILFTGFFGPQFLWTYHNDQGEV